MGTGYSDYPTLQDEDFVMTKRSRIKRESEESKALKKLRINSGLSQRELAIQLRVPQTKVSHTENGRAYILSENELVLTLWN